MRDVLFLCIIIFNGTLLFSRELPDSCLYEKDNWPEVADSLSDSITRDVSIDTSYSPAFYTALAHYPDLYDTEIHFKEKAIKTTAATRPKFFSVFKKPENRSYQIFVNDKNKPEKSVYYKDLPYNARIGLLGHELSHILDFSKMSSMEIFGMGIKYVFSPKYRKELEYQVDQQAIEHGLGWQVYTFTDYINNKSQACPEYISYKRKYYMLPEEIIEYINLTDRISEVADY